MISSTRLSVWAQQLLRARAVERNAEFVVTGTLRSAKGRERARRAVEASHPREPDLI